MLLLSQTLCWDLASRRAWEEGKELCVWGNPCHHMLSASPLDFMRKALPHFMCQICILEGEKRKRAGDFIQDTVFHQVLLLLQALEGNSGNSLSQSFSYFCFPSSCPSSAVSGTHCPSAGEVSLHSHPSAPHADRLPAHPAGKGRLVATSRDMPEDSATQSWNVQPLRSLEARQRQRGQVFLFLAVGSNSFLLYKTHQNFISMRNPSVEQCISFVSGRTAKYLDAPQTPCMQSPPAPHGRALQLQAQSMPTGLAGPKRQPHARHCPVGHTQVPWQSSRLWTVYRNHHMNVPHKDYRWNKRRWGKKRKIITDLRAVGELWPNKEKASCCQWDEICIFAQFVCVV